MHIPLRPSLKGFCGPTEVQAEINKAVSAIAGTRIAESLAQKQGAVLKPLT
jgi:hypothetical protein